MSPPRLQKGVSHSTMLLRERMPIAPRKPCSALGCRALADTGSRCPQHAAISMRGRRHLAAQWALYNSKAWKTLRREVLRAQPLCAHPGCLAPSRDCAHIISARRAPGLALLRSNVRALCHAHHSSETVSRESWHHAP